MGVPFNELNRVLDLGFRRLPWGDRGYVASRLMEVGDDAARARAAAASPVNNGDLAVLRVPFSVSQEGEPASEVDSGAAFSPLGRTKELIVDSSGESHEASYALSISNHPFSRMSALLNELSELSAPVESRVSSEEIPVPIRVVAAGAARHHQQSTINHQLVRKLRRFFFEQRGRVLARLLSEPPLAQEQLKNQVTIGLFDWPDEAAKAAEIKLPPGTSAEHAEKLLQALRQASEKLGRAVTARLKYGRETGETPVQLGDRVRAVYNGATEVLVNEIMSTAHFS